MDHNLLLLLPLVNIIEFQHKVSHLAKEKIPFFFLIDFELQHPLVVKLEDAKSHGLQFDVNGISNFTNASSLNTTPHIKGIPIEKSSFKTRFNNVKEHIHKGDTFLLNLTFSTPLESNHELQELFFMAKAPYKLHYRDKFVVFSPECFVRINNNKIHTYPMKGTIDASVEFAEKKLIADSKELREHNTIVDLLRNDLSMVAKQVHVKKFRYIDRIITNAGEILQTSSEIVGTLPDKWQNDLGRILVKLLPAGSVSGAPKKKTLEIISKNENGSRGYYTGVFGVFDGVNLDSAVAIRFIEKKNDQLFYRSGGGITALSNMDSEYQEIKQKIYVPTV